MGDNYLKQQAGNFRRQRDVALEDVRLPRLFTRPDVVSRTFHGRPYGDEMFTPGERLFAMPDRDNEKITLMRDSHRVGVIEGDGAKALLSTWADGESPDVVLMRVKTVLGISGVAELVLSEN
jgi:hypothetical protein